MNCETSRRLLEVDVDGELDLVTHLELDDHLRGCPDCRKFAEIARNRRSALRSTLPRFTAPASLAEKITARSRGTPTPAPEIKLRSQARQPWWGALAASIALALIGGYALGNSRAHRDGIFVEAITDHIRSLQTQHLTDVASTDQHTVKPWFTGKIDFAPPVVDLANASFPLEGGRLEYLDGRPAVALVYRHRQHPINLFIWPTQKNPVSAGQTSRDGYAAEAWNQGDMNFLAVSEIPARELADFIHAFQAATRPIPSVAK